MEQNNLQIGREEAGPTVVSSGSVVVSGIQNDGVVIAGATSGGSDTANGGAGATSKGIACVGATITGAAVGGANGVAQGGADAGGGVSAAAAAAGSTVSAAAAAAGSTVSAAAAAGPSSKTRRIPRHSQHQINELEKYFKKDTHPKGLKRNELARTLGMEPMQVLSWFQNKRSQMRTQNDREENEALRHENGVLRAQHQHFTDLLSKNICPECGVDRVQQSVKENMLRYENIRLREEENRLKSVITRFIADQDLQNLPLAFQDSQNPSTSQNSQNLPMSTHNSQNLQIMSQNPQDPQDLHVMSKADNARTTNTSSGDRLNTVDLLTSVEVRQSITELVISAAEELKQKAMAMEPLWSFSNADGTPSMLNEVEYLATFPNLFGLTRLGYTCEASRHLARVLLSPTQLLTILMNVNEWAFMFSSIVSRALTLGILNEGLDHNTALQVVDAEYHISTPLIPKREICFARYCTQFSEGMWAVVDVSLDNILPTLRNTTCQKKPSGCLIQAMADGTSMITWIEHVYVDHNGVSDMYKHLILSGVGYGAKRWVSVLERQGQRLATAMSSNVHNRLLSSAEGRVGILNLAERMSRDFFIGITGPTAGRWTNLKWDFNDNIWLNSARVMDDSGIQNGTLLSVSASFVLSDSPKMVFDFLRDHNCRKEWDINATLNDYEPVFNISYGEGAGNLISIFKVPTSRQGYILQESWSDAVASHIVFSSIETWIINAILGGGNPDGLPLLPSGFTIMPDGPSFGEEGTSRTLLTVSFQVLVNRSPLADITLTDAAKLVHLLRRSCDKIKHALDTVDPNA